MADPNALNNKQLREKCLEYGLPNVPVTDSSRKILIKRLQAIMLVKEPTKPTTTKATLPKNRRKTVAETIPTEILSVDEDNIEVTTKRRSLRNRSRTTQIAAPKTTVNNTATSKVPCRHTNSPNIVPLEIGSRTKSTKINASDPRQRRIVSSKTGVLSTSCSQETKPLQTIYEQNGENDCEVLQENENKVVELQRIPVTQSSYTQNQDNDTQSNFTAHTYGASNLPTQTMRSKLNLSKPRLYPNLQDTGLHTSYNSSDETIAGNISKSGQINKSTTSYIPSSSQPPINKIQYTSIVGGSNSDCGFSTSPISNITLRCVCSDMKHFTAVGANKRHNVRTVDEKEATSCSYHQYELPYLNKFSRKLQNLQLDPIVKRTSSSYAAKASTSTPVASYYSSFSPMEPKRRRATYQRDNDISFAQFWTVLEQKYHLNQALFFVMLFVVTVFFYALFMQ